MLLEAIFINNMVMVVEEGQWEGWVMVFCAHLWESEWEGTFVGTKITPSKDITEGGGD